MRYALLVCFSLSMFSLGCNDAQLAALNKELADLKAQRPPSESPQAIHPSAPIPTQTATPLPVSTPAVSASPVLGQIYDGGDFEISVPSEWEKTKDKQIEQGFITEVQFVSPTGGLFILSAELPFYTGIRTSVTDEGKAIKRFYKEQDGIKTEWGFSYEYSNGVMRYVFDYNGLKITGKDYVISIDLVSNGEIDLIESKASEIASSFKYQLH